MIVPVRRCLVGFGAIVKVTVPVRVPGRLAVIRIHEAFVWAFQVQPGPLALTLIFPAPPDVANVAETGEIVTVQPGCLSGKITPAIRSSVERAAAPVCRQTP